MFSFVSQMIASGGLAGVFALMLAENLLPVIPSELILPMAGYVAARGAFSPILALVVAAAASVLGGLAWYAAGRWFGFDRLHALARRWGRWMAVTPEELERAQRWFERWCGWAVLLGRTLPGVRSIIPLPAGISRMRLLPFVLWSSAGAAIWSALLIWAGVLLGQRYREVQSWLDPVTDVFLGLCLAAYLFRLVRPGRPARLTQIKAEAPGRAPNGGVAAGRQAGEARR